MRLRSSRDCGGNGTTRLIESAAVKNIHRPPPRCGETPLERVLRCLRRLEKKLVATEKELLAQIKSIATQVADVKREVGETKTAVDDLRNSIKTGMTQAEVDEAKGILDGISADLAGFVTDLDATQKTTPTAP